MQTDPSGSVVAVMLSASQVPPEGLTIDLTTVQNSRGQPFGAIHGVTMDCTGTNLAVAMLTLRFDQLGISRLVNGGVAQTIRVVGGASRMTILNGLWTSGTITVVLSTSAPSAETSSPIGLSVVSGSVAVTGLGSVSLGKSYLPMLQDGGAAINNYTAIFLASPLISVSLVAASTSLLLCDVELAVSEATGGGVGVLIAAITDASLSTSIIQATTFLTAAALPSARLIGAHGAQYKSTNGLGFTISAPATAPVNTSVNLSWVLL